MHIILMVLCTKRDDVLRVTVRWIAVDVMVIDDVELTISNEAFPAIQSVQFLHHASCRLPSLLGLHHDDADCIRTRVADTFSMGENPNTARKAANASEACQAFVRRSLTFIASNWMRTPFIPSICLLVSAAYFLTREHFFTTVMLGSRRRRPALAMLVKLARSAGMPSPRFRCWV
jgi:hypothetical protein